MTYDIGGFGEFIALVRYREEALAGAHGAGRGRCLGW
jgi:hypothetical protein